MKRKVSSILAAGLLAAAPFLSLIPTSHSVAASPAVTFGVVGDHGDSSDPGATGVFKAIGANSLDFFQSVGDLSYNSDANVPNWCQYVKDTINTGAGYAAGNSYGENFPFMLATGNHETNEQTNGSDIDTFTQCLPNKLASQTTLSPNVGSGSDNYAKEYFYDYPATTPLVRVIITSPGMQLNSNGTYTYTSGNAHYQWLSDSIDSARSSGIKWIVVINHKNYITSGTKSDEIGSDFFNLLVSKKVDLVVQGHEHDYQRSKQLALSTGCTTVPKGSYDSSCVVDSDASMAKGAGTLLLINGMGGHSEYNISGSDSENGYFAKTMGANSSNATYGFTKITLTDTSLSAAFVPGVGIDNGFTDSFTISEATAPATDTTAPTVSLSAPADSSALVGSSDLTATASDNVGVTKVEFYANTTKLGESTTSPYSYTWDTTSAANGAYTLTAKAYDAAGNATSSSAVNVTVNNPTPARFSVDNPDSTSTSVALTGDCSTLKQSGAASSTPSSLDSSKLISSFGFTTTCGSAGGAVQVKADLGKSYTAANLKVYKDQADKSVKDITSEVQIENQTVGSEVHTFVIYTAKDGDLGDTDGTVNSTIVDPVYVLDATTTAAAQDQDTLVDTGVTILGGLLLGGALVFGAVKVWRQPFVYRLLQR